MGTTVAIDCMGGDRGAEITIPAALEALKRDAHLTLILVGRRTPSTVLLDDAGPVPEAVCGALRFGIVAMDDPPAIALRKKKDSSMRVAVDLVKDGEAKACGSAGNTGALMAISRFVLKTLPGIDRPAIASILPRWRGSAACSTLARTSIAPPSTYSSSASWGPSSSPHWKKKNVRAWACLISGRKRSRQRGRQEGRRVAAGERLNFTATSRATISTGTTDVVVCDGFVGNVALKAWKVSPDVHHLPARGVRTQSSKPPRCDRGMARDQRLQAPLDHRRYNGATLLGLRGIVIKSHGSADAFAFGYAIRRAAEEARGAVLAHISERMASLHKSAT